MKLRSIFSLVLVLMMTLSVFAGCSRDKGTGGDASTTTPTTTSGSLTQTVQGRPMLDLSIYHWALKEFDPSKDPFAKLIQDRFKVNITPVVYETDGQKKLAAASKSLPDVFDVGVLYDIPTFNQWIQQSIVREIPEDMLAKFPATKTRSENVNTWRVVREANDNKIWYIARPSATTAEGFKTDWTGYYYRKDWLANVGITKPIETWDEAYEAMKAFVEKDPDQDGATDTGGITCNTMWMILNSFCAWRVNCEDWVSEGGKWIPGYMQSKTKDALKFWQKMYNDGLIDPEFRNNTPNQAMQKFAGHNFGMIIRDANTWWIWNVVMNQFGNANKDIKDPMEVIKVANNFKVNANEQPYYAENADAFGIMFNANLSDEKLERYMEIHEWMMSEEARYLQLGFEGEDYKKDEQGRIVNFTDPDTGKPYDLTVKYPAKGMLTLVSWRLENSIDLNWPDPIIQANIKQVTIDNMAERDLYPLKQNLKLKMLSTPSLNIIETRDFANAFAAMIMSTDPVDTAFDKFVQDEMAAGVSSAIDEVNAKAQAMGILP